MPNTHVEFFVAKIKFHTTLENAVEAVAEGNIDATEELKEDAEILKKKAHKVKENVKEKAHEMKEKVSEKMDEMKEKHKKA